MELEMNTLLVNSKNKLKRIGNHLYKQIKQLKQIEQKEIFLRTTKLYKEIASEVSILNY